jgi:hypothetical protein
MTTLVASPDFAARSGHYAVNAEGVFRDDHRIADAGGYALNCVLERFDGEVLVGADAAHLLRLEGDHLTTVEGFEHADGRDRWHTPWGGPPDVRSMSEGPDGTLYVNVHVGGILRSRDGGATWEPTLDMDVDVHRVLALGDGTVLAACGDGGLAVSRDGGDSWVFLTEGLHGTYCRAVAVAGGSVLVTASTGPFTKEGAVYRKPLDGDGPFERTTELFPWNIDSFQLAGSPDGQAAFGTEDGRVYVSTDEGATWELTEKADKTIRSVTFS